MGKKKQRAREDGDAGAEAAAVNLVRSGEVVSPLFAGNGTVNGAGGGEKDGLFVLARKLATSSSSSSSTSFSLSPSSSGCGEQSSDERSSGL